MFFAHQSIGHFIHRAVAAKHADHVVLDPVFHQVFVGVVLFLRHIGADIIAMATEDVDDTHKVGLGILHTRTGIDQKKHFHTSLILIKTALFTK